MAETGLSSAFGLAIEDVWRSAPVTLSGGTAYNLGVAVRNPLRFCVVEPGAGVIGKSTIMTPDNEIDGDVTLSRTIKTDSTYNGQYAIKLDGENGYYPLLGMLGRDIQTQIQTVSSTIDTAMFNHSFRPFKFAPSFTIEEIFGSGRYGRVSTGTLIQRTEITFGKVVMMTVTLIPFRQIPNQYADATGALNDYIYGQTANKIPKQLQGWVGNGTNTWSVTPAPTYVDVQQETPQQIYGNGPFVFAGIGILPGTIGGANFASTIMCVNNVPITNTELLEGFTITINRTIAADMIGGSGYDPGIAVGSQVTVSGKFDLLYEDTTFQLAQLKHSKVALNFKVVGVIPGNLACTTPYSLEVYLPNCRLTTNSGPTMVDGPIQVGGDYVARKDPALGYPVRIDLVNQFDNTALGGAWAMKFSTVALTTAVTTYVAGAGTTTGWQIGDVMQITDGVNTDTVLISGITRSTGTFTFTPALANTYTAATITKVGIGTTTTAVATATAIIPMTSKFGLEIGAPLIAPGYPNLIINSISGLNVTVNQVVTLASGAIVYRPMYNALGLGGWTPQ